MADTYDVNKDKWPTAIQANWQARRAFGVTPDDNKDLTNSGGDNDPLYAKALYIGVTGDVAVVMTGDQTNGGSGTPVTFKAHPVGYMPCMVRRVMSTGTTATNIVALTD